MAEPGGSTPSGVLLVDKPEGWTSHQVVGRVRRLLGTRKVGHAGTLDPMATGLLVVGVGRATRLLGHLTRSDKSYRATLRLGQGSVTDDAEGELTDPIDTGHLTEAQVLTAVQRYRGRILQVPSAVSAIKVSGQRAYALVRRGDEVDLPAREVTIHRLEVTALRRVPLAGVTLLDLDIDVDCTSGTYIRALARDIGRDLGVGAHLTRLRRTHSGPFAVTEAQLAGDGLAGSEPPPLLSLAEVAQRCFAWVEVDDSEARDVGFGRSLARAVPADPTALLHAGRLLALYRPEGGRSVPVAVLA